MIEIVDLCKKFDSKILFDRFSLTIPTGGFFVIAGSSGCGKTTLLNTIGGLEKPDSGSVFIDGEDLYRRKSKRSFYLFKVGFLFQNFALIEDRTVRDYERKKAYGCQTDHFGMCDRFHIRHGQCRVVFRI